MTRGPKPIFICSCGNTYVSKVKASAHATLSGHEIRQVQ